jgi:hypothetical protein
MQWTPVVVVAREQPWQSTGVYTVLLLAGGQQPAWVEMKVVQSLDELEAVAVTANSQATDEARKRRMLTLVLFVFLAGKCCAFSSSSWTSNRSRILVQDKKRDCTAE